MMHVDRVKFFLCLLITIACFASCNSRENTRSQQRYYYYPNTNIYYDLKNLEYIYSLDSGRTWVKMKTAAGKNAPPALGEQVEVKEMDDNIWFENETHRNMYGGMLFNVITKDTALLTENSPASQVKKAVPQRETDDNPKKKKNIFQRIFGKKKS